MKIYKNYLITFMVCLLSISLFFRPQMKIQAQGININWQPPVNISNSPSTSTDPFLLADPAGFAHLFWAEKTGPAPGNSADTILYSVWNGQTWTKPVDLYLSPLSDGNPVATYPRGVFDENGIIHLIWMTLPNFPRYALNYQQILSRNGTLLNSESSPSRLAEDLTGQQYSADIAYNPEQGLHVIYARGTGGIEGRAITYISSPDKGETWSYPRDIYKFSDPKRGGSNLKILLEPPNYIYLSWTEWDESGNGQAVYFTYSEDNGVTWANPFPLSVRLENEYERDWNNFALLGPGELVSIWEGGFRAYRGVMYSYDHGKTWTTPYDVFPTLIGDNGAVQFAKDSLNRLHVFIANRIREGYDVYGDRLGLWHSIYLGDERWSKPAIATVYGEDTNMTNPTVTIVGGNTIIAAWYGSQIYEINVMTGTITDAPSLLPTPWPTIQPLSAELATFTPESPDSTSEPSASPIPDFSNNSPPSNPGEVVYLSIIFPVVVIVSIVFYYRKKGRR
ncbi:MAG: sialidase family protein [Chloroflexota bacterium]